MNTRSEPQALQSEEAELVGYVIPPPVIQHFIEDYAKNGCFTAFPSLGIEWQKLENPQMRRALGLKVQFKALPDHQLTSKPVQVEEFSG